MRKSFVWTYAFTPCNTFLLAQRTEKSQGNRQGSARNPHGLFGANEKPAGGGGETVQIGQGGAQLPVGPGNQGADGDARVVLMEVESWASR